MTASNHKALIAGLQKISTEDALYRFVRSHSQEMSEAFFETLRQAAFFPDLPRAAVGEFLKKFITASERNVQVEPDAFMVIKLGACYAILAEIAATEQNYDLAIDHYRHAIEIAEIQEDTRPLAMLLRDLGFTLHKAGQMEKAFAEWQKAAEIFWQLGEDQLETELSVMVHGACWVSGAFDYSLDFAEKSLAVYQKKGNRKGICRELNAQGLLFSFIGLVEESVQRFKKARQLAASINDDRIEERNTMGNLARTYAVSGQFEAAKLYYEEILKLSGGQSRQDQKMQLFAYRNLGLVFRELGKPQEALLAFQKALTFAGQLNDENKTKNRLLSSIGLAHRDLGNISDARHFFQIALDSAVEFNDKVGESDAWGHLGNYHYEMNQFSQAEIKYRQALDFAQKIGDSIAICRWTGNLANTLLQLAHKAENTNEKIQKHSAAKVLYKEALNISQNVADLNHQYLWNYNLGSYYRHVCKKPEKAFEYYRESIRCLEVLRGQIKQDDFSRLFGESKFLVYHDMVNTCLSLKEHRSEAFEYAEHGKGYTLMRRMAQTEPDVADSLVKRYLEINQSEKSLRHRLATGAVEEPPLNLSSSGFYQALQAHLLKVSREKQAIVKEISKFHPEFIETIQPHTVSIGDVQNFLSRLEKSTALVEFFITSEKTNIFLIWTDNWKIIEIPGFAETNLIQDYYPGLRALYDRFADIRNEKSKKELSSELIKICHEFYHACWHQVQSELDNLQIERLIVIPHRALHLFPFHLIPLAGESHDPSFYLMDQYEVTYSPSFRMLKFCLSEDRKNRKKKNFLAINNPDQSLAFADLEAWQIAKLFAQSRIIEHSQATIDAVLTEPDRHHFIHYATHGNRFGSSSDFFETNMLLANGKVLHPDDIFTRMKIRQSFGVILSACESGQVQLDRGDEYVGFPAAFLYAGAPSVISSLWSVDDLSTTLLMIRWYQNVIGEKMHRGEALKRAQSWLRQVSVGEIKSFILPYLAKEIPRLEKSIAQQSDSNLAEKLARRLSVCREKARYFNAEEDSKRPFCTPYDWGGFIVSGNPE